MKLRKQFSNLKKGAKKVFIGMLVLCLISTVTGIGSIFAYADYDPNHPHDYGVSYRNNNNGTHTQIFTCTEEGCNDSYEGETLDCYDSNGDGSCEACNGAVPTLPSCEHTNTRYDINSDTHTLVCADCGEALGSPEGHDFSDWAQDPDDASKEKRTCSVCVHFETRDAQTPPACEHANMTYTYDAEGHIGTCEDCGTSFERTNHNLRYVGNDAEGNLLYTCECGYTYTKTPGGDRSRAIPKDFTQVVLSTSYDFWNMTSGTYPFYTLKYIDPADPDNPITLTPGNDFTVTPASSNLFTSPVEPGNTIQLTFTGNGTSYTADTISDTITVPSANWTVSTTEGSNTVTLQSGINGVELSGDNTSYSQSINLTVDGADTFDIYAKATNGFAVKHTVSNIKNIGALPYSRAADNYQVLDSSKDITDFYTISDGGTPLQKGYQYDVVADSNPLTTIPETGTNITLTYNGKGLYNDNYYVGTSSQTVYVAEVNVLLNGQPQKASYSEAVNFTADGYTICDSATGTFNTVFTYNTPTTSEPGGKKDLTLYFKKDGTSRIVKQTIEDLAIDDTAGIKILYDGSETKNAFYYGSVRISATGFYVCGEEDSGNAHVWNDTYDISGAGSHNKVLHFKNKTTGVVSNASVIVTILDEILIDVYYNGSELKDWYNGDVVITAKNLATNPVTYYKIATEDNKNDASKYKSSYVMSGTGTISEKLYFIPRDATSASSSNWEEYTFVVNIDKTAPTGSIYAGSYSSSAFTTKDEVKAYVNSNQGASISASDVLSGIDYIHYYVSDKFYSSSSDLLAGISEKSGAWRTYSSSSTPTLQKDQNNYIYAELVDKAGNKTYISLGSILYDTVAPKMTTAKVAPATDGTSSIIGVAGTDKLSGVDRFKFIYGEKKEGKNDTPSKKEVFENGMTISTEKESDGTSVGSRTITDIDPKKIYMFYFVAVDRADNISEVMLQEVNGADAASKEAQNAAKEEAKKGNSSGSNGLSPAPNGIAGGGSGSGKQGGGSGSSGSSAQKSSKDKKSQSALGDKDREINRNPYIAEATGNVKIGLNETSGWNKIASEVNKADKGAVIEVEMAGLSNVSNELFTSMNNRDVQVKLRMAEDVEWEIKGEEVPDARSDIDMGVRLGSRNIPEQIISDVAGTNPHVEFSINHNGDFGFVATIAVPVGESNKGMYTTLYHYDETKKELEVAGDGRVDDRGYAKFPLTHASDYTVVITPERILSAADTDAQTSTLVGAEAESQSSQYLDGARLRLTDLFRIKGSMRIWLFFIALLSATICMVILYLPALQSRNQNDQGDLF